MSSSVAVDQIGSYAIDSELGRGAFGVVYRAHHVDRPDEPVALKIIEGRGHLERLMIEPALLAQLDHPCIVGIEDYFRFGDRLVLILEFIKGEDLKTQMDRGEAFSQELIRDFLVQMAGALATAHARQIIHRDIKPSNILIARQGNNLRFVLTDFGIGQRVEGVQDRKHTGGTYLYMAPEQLRGRPEPQSDLWALGVVAYRMLTGKHPFPGPSLPELAQQIMYGDAPPPSQVCSEPVDPELEKVIVKLLDKSLQERVSSAEELLNLLEFRGQPTEVLAHATVVKRPKPLARDALDRQLARSIRWRKIWLFTLLAVYVLPGNGLIPPLVRIFGLWLFYKGQVDYRMRWRRRVIFLAGAVFCFLSGAAMSNIPSLNPVARMLGETDSANEQAESQLEIYRQLFIKKEPSSPLTNSELPPNAIGGGPNAKPSAPAGASPPNAVGEPRVAPTSPRTRVYLPGSVSTDNNLLDALGPFLLFLMGFVVIVVFLIWVIILPAWAAYVYVGLRRRQREKVLRDAALISGKNSDRYLEVLRSSLDYRYADVAFHLKYAEALVSRGRHRNAAVEARLILEQDPYNFNGNLLLANSYYTLGLHADCTAVCEAYLDISGYCFEFAELRDLCRKRAVAP